MINLSLIKSNIEGKKVGDVGGTYTDWYDITSEGGGYCSYFSPFSSVTPSLFTVYKYITRTDDSGNTTLLC